MRSWCLFVTCVARHVSTRETSPARMQVPWQGDVHLLVGAGNRRRAAHHAPPALRERKAGPIVTFLFKEFELSRCVILSVEAKPGLLFQHLCSIIQTKHLLCKKKKKIPALIWFYTDQRGQSARPPLWFSMKYPHSYWMDRQWSWFSLVCTASRGPQRMNRNCWPPVTWPSMFTNSVL